MLLLYATGLAGTGATAIGHVWYISAMLIAMMIIYPIILKTRKSQIFACVYAPILACLIYSFQKARYGMAQGDTYAMLDGGLMVHTMLLRAMAGILMGCFIFCMSERCKEIKLTRIGVIVFKGIEIALLFVVYGVIMQKKAWTNWDFIIILCFVVILFIAVTFEWKISNQKVVGIITYLGKLSLPIYLFQNTPAYIMKIMEVNQYNNYVVRSVVFIGVLTIMSVIGVWFVEKLLPRIMKKVKYCLFV